MGKPCALEEPVMWDHRLRWERPRSGRTGCPRWYLAKIERSGKSKKVLQRTQEKT